MFRLPHRSRTSLIVAPSILVSLTLVSCYTVLRHPEPMKVVSDVSHGEQEERVCAECHYESEWLGYFDHPLIYGTAGYYAYDWWYDYYRRPWWFDDYWYFDYAPPAGSATGGASSWTQRSLRRGEGPPRPPSGSAYPASPRSGDSSSGVSSSGQGTQAGDSKKKSEPQPSYGKKSRKPRR